MRVVGGVLPRGPGRDGNDPPWVADRGFERGGPRGGLGVHERKGPCLLKGGDVGRRDDGFKGLDIDVPVLDIRVLLPTRAPAIHSARQGGRRRSIRGRSDG